MANKALKFTEGEKGFVHTFNVLEEDNSAADVSWATGVRLVILDEVNNVVKLDITANLAIVGSTVQWSVQDGQTNYNGILVAVLHFTAAGRLEKTYDFPVIVEKKKV